MSIGRTFRETNLIVSLPIPRRSESGGRGEDCLTHHNRLRQAFNACLKANVRSDSRSDDIGSDTRLGKG